MTVFLKVFLCDGRDLCNILLSKYAYFVAIAFSFTLSAICSPVTRNLTSTKNFYLKIHGLAVCVVSFGPSGILVKNVKIVLAAEVDEVEADPFLLLRGRSHTSNFWAVFRVYSRTAPARPDYCIDLILRRVRPLTWPPNVLFISFLCSMSHLKVKLCYVGFLSALFGPSLPLMFTTLSHVVHCMHFICVHPFPLQSVSYTHLTLPTILLV